MAERVCGGNPRPQSMDPELPRQSNIESSWFRLAPFLQHPKPDRYNTINIWYGITSMVEYLLRHDITLHYSLV